MVMNKEFQIIKLREYYKKNYPDRDIDSIDFEAMLDSTLTFNENKSAIKKTLGFEITTKEIENKAEEYGMTARKQEEEQTAKELNEALQKIKDTKAIELDKYFRVVDDYVKALVNAKDINSLILLGEAGIGKSYRVIKALTDLNKEHSKDWVMINTHITPLEQYEFLYNNNGKIIIYDDIIKIFDDPVNLGILLSALWNPMGKRMISYMSSSDKLNAPKSFEFKGKIIFLTNKLAEQLDTIKTRAFTINLEFSWEDKVKIIYELVKLYKMPMEVADWIKKHSNKASNLNFRLPFKVYELLRSHPDRWKKLAQLQINFDKEKAMVVELLTSSLPVKEQIRRFITETGRSRATFFRWKSEVQTQSIMKLESD